MITSATVKKSQLEGMDRLDAEYYQPEYFIDFSKGNWQPIGDFLQLCQYGISQAMNDEQHGYPIFKMDDIRNAFLFNDGVRYAEISEKNLHEFYTQKNDIFFNRVNAEQFVGRTGIYKTENYPSVFASYLIRLRLKNNVAILPDYLNIFLNSAFGIKQIRKFSRRAVNQANVNAEELKLIKVLIPSIDFQKQIAVLSSDSWNNFKQAELFYLEAENILLEELGLKNEIVEDSLYTIVRLSEIKTANRMDAEYFQPKYEELISKIKGHNSESFYEIVQNVPAKFNPPSQPEKMFRYIELSDINSSIGTIETFSELSGKEAPSRAKRVLLSGDVIVSSVEGSLEKVALVDKTQEGCLASTGFFQLRSKEILSEVLLVMAKSMVIRMQLQKHAAGTILTAVPKEALKNIVIPIISKPIQQKIADLVCQSHQARKKAKELLEEAKQKVEEMIEKS